MNRPRLICLLLALITLLAYLPVSRHAFIGYDDGDYITQNKTVQAGLTWAGVKWSFNDWHFSNWHPLTWLSHMMDCELFGLNPTAHHLINVLIHAANAVLLFLLLLRMTSALWPAAIVAALFAWHPLHIESVAWAAERKDVLSTFFGLLALLAYTRFVNESKRENPRSKKSYIAALIFFTLSLLSKPMLVTLPFVLLLLDYWPLRRFELKNKNPKLKTLLLEKVPFFLLTFAFCIITYLAQRSHAVISLQQHPLDLRVGNAVLSYGRYLLKAIWPLDLAIVYPLPSQIVWAQVVVATAFILAISVCFFATRRRSPYLIVGWLWFLGTLVPVIGLVQVGRAAMADRYSYVPLIGIFIAAVFGIQSLAAKYKFKSTSISLLAVLVLSGCLISMERQLSFWRDDETLFGHAVAVTQNNATAHINLGVALEQQGRRDAALTNYQEALRIDAKSVEALNDLANLLDGMGKPDEALTYYRKALQLDPKAELAHLNLGTLLIELGLLDEAMKEYSEAARLAPEDARPLYLIAKAQLRQGHDAEAVSSLRAALRFNEYDIQIMTWLARVQATDEKPEIRNANEAITLAERANNFAGGKIPFVLDTLAMAYAEAGRFTDAIRTIQDAINIFPTAGDNESAKALSERLQLYQSNKPYRESFIKQR